MIVKDVKQLIQDRPLAEIAIDQTVLDACRVMCELDARAVVVVDGRDLLGVVSERDVIKKCICAGHDPATTQVSETMTREPKTVTADDNLALALEIMSKGGFHHVPVTHGGQVVGLLSSDDIPEEYRMMLERFKEMRGG